MAAILGRYAAELRVLSLSKVSKKCVRDRLSPWRGIDSRKLTNRKRPLHFEAKSYKNSSLQSHGRQDLTERIEIRLRTVKMRKLD